jgi:putative endonuclease
VTRAGPTREDAEHLRTGRLAEDRAKAYLEQQGLRCRERNFRTRVGEIDLIMEDRGALVFVEVRYRRNRRYGGALESIDRRKCSRLLATAQWYLNLHRTTGPSRFDVLAVEPNPDGSWNFVWVKDAIRDN